MNRVDYSRVGWVQERDRNKPTFTQAPCARNPALFSEAINRTEGHGLRCFRVLTETRRALGGSSQILKLRGLDSRADSSPSFLLYFKNTIANIIDDNNMERCAWDM